MAVALQPTKHYEPKPRYRHYAASAGVRGQIVVFAGITADIFKNKEKLSSHIEVFDNYLEQWTSVKTTGSLPKGLYGGGCCVSSSGELFVYGGHYTSTFCGAVYKLSSLRKWEQLSAESDANGPMKKVDCGLVCFMETKIAVIGGYGLPHGPSQPGSSFVKDESSTDDRGWTNEIHIFDSEKCKSSLNYMKLSTS